jgi:hypothetical protein
VNVTQFGIANIRQADAFGAIARNIREREALQRFSRMHSGNVGHLRAIVQAYVRELEVADGRDALVAGRRSFVLKAAGEYVAAQESTHRSRNIEIAAGNVLNESAPSYPALDVNCEGLGVRDFAALDSYVADTARSLAADSLQAKIESASVQLVIWMSSQVCINE